MQLVALMAAAVAHLLTFASAPELRAEAQKAGAPVQD
jgi:hypothetical protein